MIIINMIKLRNRKVKVIVLLLLLLGNAADNYAKLTQVW